MPGTAVTSLTRLGLMALGVGIVGACHATDAVAPQTTVHFVIDAPLCSSILPVQFFIDSLQVGTDTFVVGIIPEHTISRGFTTSPGRHTLSALVVAGYVWPDTIVTLPAGEVFIDSLPFYCS